MLIFFLLKPWEKGIKNAIASCSKEQKLCPSFLPGSDYGRPFSRASKGLKILKTFIIVIKTLLPGKLVFKELHPGVFPVSCDNSQKFRAERSPQL